MTIRLQEREPGRGRASSGEWRIPVSVSLRRTRRLFQPFIQVAKGTHGAGGNVIGAGDLSKLVDLVGGDVVMHSEPGKGTRCRSTCSCASAGRKCLNPARTRWRHPWSVSPPAISSSPTTIRLNFPCRLRQQLEFLATGWRQRGWPGGAGAWALTSASEVPISDCNMPRLNGYQLYLGYASRNGSDARRSLILLYRRRRADEVQRSTTRAWMIACSSRSASRPCATTSRPLSDATPPAPGASDAAALSSLGGDRPERLPRTAGDPAGSNRQDLQRLAIPSCARR